MKQTVTIHRTADRHAELHRRQFAETREATVEAGDLADVLDAALDVMEMSDAAPGQFTISIDWPHE